MPSPEVLASQRAEFLRQPPLGLAMERRSLSEMKDVLGRDAKLIGEGDEQKLIFTAKGKDPFSGESVRSVTTYNNLGFIESIRSNRKGQPTTYVEYTYRQFAESIPVEAEVFIKPRYEIAQTTTYLEVAGARRSPARREHIETAKFAWEIPEGQTKPVLKRSFSSYEGNTEMLQAKLDAGVYAGAFPTFGTAAVDAKDTIALARELAVVHPGYRVTDKADGSTVVEVLLPSKSNLSISPVRNLLVRKSFDSEGRIAQVEMLAHPLRPGIDPIRSDLTMYTYKDGYMTQVVQKNDQTPAQIYTFSHSRALSGPTGQVVVVDQMKYREDTAGASEMIFISLEDDWQGPYGSHTSLAHSPSIDGETTNYMGFLGFQVTKEEEVDGVLIRHISAPTLPEGQEIVIENPGPEGRISVRAVVQK